MMYDIYPRSSVINWYNAESLALIDLIMWGFAANK